MNVPIVAAIAAVAIVFVVVFSTAFQNIFKERARLVREQRAREDAADAADRRRAEYERDIGYVADVFDPLSLFHS